MKIAKILLWCTCVLCECLCAVQSQNTDDVGKIALSVVVSEKMDDLNASHLSKLESKVAQIVTKSGLAATGYNQTFVIYPKLDVSSVNVVEGGMQNITVVKAELSLFIKQTANNVLFASVSKTLKGSGKTKEAALVNLISQIPAQDKAFAAFIEEGKGKIIAYFEAQCETILKQADACAKQQNYAEAVAMLMQMPQEVTSCYDKALAKAVDYFNAYQEQVCQSLILQAKTQQAQRDFAGALNTLAGIDPTSSCKKDAETLVADLESKVTAEEKKQWDFLVQQHKDAVALESQRITAIKEMAVAYYKNQPKTVTNNLIIR